MRVLLTGGAGFIGSHTALELLEHDHEVVVVDNLSNSSREALHRVAEITGRTPLFFQIDLRNEQALDAVFRSHRPDAVIHFAGLKAVGESTQKPLLYFRNNFESTLSLLDAMHRYGVTDLVFSSSATVYGDPASSPITEDFPLFAVNPYGRTKLVIEDMLRDLSRAEPDLRIILLRYFNPVGAHPSGRIGEDPRGIPNNLLPYVMQVATGRLEKLSVFGNDYPTPDGSGIRDYIHVMDLAAGHRAALEALPDTRGCIALNLGTGRGHSVLEVVAAAERAIGRPVPHEIAPRRPGDAAICFADPARAERLLGWKAVRGLDEMVADAWRFASRNPAGYEG